MNVMLRKSRSIIAMSAMVAGMLIGGTAIAGTQVVLSGTQEAPAVKTTASGSGTITVGADKSVTGSVTTSGIVGTMAHIHQAAMGKNGPVVIPLQQTAPNVWSVPPGAHLNDAQAKSYEAGDMYVNVHSQNYPDGEIRGQLKP